MAKLTHVYDIRALASPWPLIGQSFTNTASHWLVLTIYSSWLDTDHKTGGSILLSIIVRNVCFIWDQKDNYVNYPDMGTLLKYLISYTINISVFWTQFVQMITL